MEVKTGYKQTEVGVIPEEWDAIPLAQLGRFSKGRGIRKDEASSGTIPCVRYGEIYTHHNDIVRTYNSHISSTVAQASKRLVRGDILFAGSGETKEEIGKAVAFVDYVEAYAGGDIVILTPDSVCSHFLGYVLNSPEVLKQKASKGQGDAVVHISAAALGTVRTPLPPLPEQRAIAAALSDVDALLDGLDRLIATKRDLKQAAMQQLLTGQTRLPGFRGEWAVRSLGQLGAWKGGMTPSMQNATYWHGGDFPWISSGDVKVSRLTDTSQHVTSWAVRRGAAVVVPANSLVLVTRSGILRKYLPVALVAKPMAINQDIKALIPTETVSAEYLLHALTGFGDAILASCLKAGTTVESVEFPWLKAFAIPLPPRDEQAVIAAALSDMDAELAALEARRHKTRDLKQAMMQELLTGKTRLVSAEPEHA